MVEFADGGDLKQHLKELRYMGVYCSNHSNMAAIGVGN